MHKSGLWKYFSTTTPPTYFRNDRSHRAAWCNACLQQYVTNGRELDALHIRSGEAEATSIRSESELRQEGGYIDDLLKFRD